MDGVAASIWSLPQVLTGWILFQGLVSLGAKIIRLVGKKQLPPPIWSQTCFSTARRAEPNTVCILSSSHPPPFRSFCMFGKCSRVCSSSPFPLQKSWRRWGKRKVGKMGVRGSFLFPLLFLKIVFFLPLQSGCLLLRSVYSRPPSLRNDWASVIRGQGLFYYIF